MSRKINWTEAGLYVIGIITGVFLLAIVVGGAWIGFEVKSRCQSAKIDYGDGLACTEALGRLAGDEKRSYGERNSAIWAMGQLGDNRALPVLEGMYTGKIPDREPWNETLSQYEIKKALKLVKGGLNITAFIWRNNPELLN